MTQPTTNTRLSFSQNNPMLQIAWDSTSVSTFKACPRKYYYSIVCGYTSKDESVDLTFGIAYHSAQEAFHRARAIGATFDQALRIALRTAADATWDRARMRPWGSNSPYKNRETLFRSIVWYFDKYKDDTLETVILANGKAAVELSWRIELGRKAATGEDMLLCGHFDRLVKFASGTWIADYKTTKFNVFEPSFFERYSPDNQFSTYTYAGQLVYNVPIKGVICDAVQVLTEESRFQRAPITRTAQQLLEWRSDLDYWIATAEACAVNGFWPQNDTACGLYGGCPFRQVCGKTPGVREDWLKVSYNQRVWDPLKTREV